MTLKKARVSALSSAYKHAEILIEQLLKEMLLGLRHPARVERGHWPAIFGPKESMVVNLQKLIQSLAAPAGN